MRKKKILILVFSTYLAFCFLYTHFKKSLENENLGKLASFLTIQLWQLDLESTEMMVKIMMESSNIEKIVVYRENGEILLEVKKDLKFLERALSRLGVFWRRIYTFELEYNNYTVGSVEFTILVKDFLVYLYAFIIAWLFETMITHYLKLRYTLRELDKTNQELKSTVEELEYTIEELERTQEYLINAEKMASIGRLVAGIAHDLNTPIGIINTSASELRGKLERLREMYESGRISKTEFEGFLDDATEIIRLIDKNSRRVIDLVRGLKGVSAHDYTVPVKFNLKKHLEDIFETLKPRLRKTKVKVHLSCPEITMRSFPGAISQIISNLVENSIIHGFEDGTIEGNIKIKVRDLDQFVEILYEDDGKGMSEDVRKRVFEPFFTTKRESGGSGLGMAIIYTLVKEKLRGEIFIESAPGKGVKIKIILPKEISRRDEI